MRRKQHDRDQCSCTVSAAEVQKYSEDEMKALLGSVRGISDRLADEAVQKMFGVEA